MDFKKQIITIGIIFTVIFSILFFNIRAEYNKSYGITLSEIDGINKITDIYKLDIQLKSLRGLYQLNTEDTKLLKKTLSIDEDDILVNIKKLQNKKITVFYNSIITQKNELSKMEIFQKYTKLLELLKNIRIDEADSSNLLFESNRDINLLITMTVLELPKIIENIGRVRALGIGLLNDNKNSKNLFLLKTNLKSFIDKIQEIKHTINKLDFNDKNRLSSLLDFIVSDFYALNGIISNIQKDKSTLNSKEYFLEVSKLVNKINNLFATSKEILTIKLEERKLDFEKKLLIATMIYILVILSILLSGISKYRKSDRDIKLEISKKRQRDFIQKIQEEYIKNENLKEILNKSLNHLVNYFNAINGTLYLFNDENQKLYLGATYGIKYDSLKHTLDLHENSISENILEKKIKIVDINEKINVGSIEVNATKLITIPIMEFEKSIGTIQLVFDDNFSKIDVDFLQSVISFMGSYINKAKQDEEADKYLKLIDKNVLISKTDLDGNIIEVSEQLCELSQYTKDELLGNTHRIFKHPDMEAEFFVNLWNTILKGNPWNGEIKDRKKDGGFYWVNTHIAFDRDINGNTIGYTAIRTDITNKKKVEEIAITDGLTSLYNRRHFDNIFAQQIAINRRAKKMLAFLLMDIDHFKQYNDTYGHQDGDTALKLVALALKATLKRPDDYVFRLGGEEFGLLYYIEKSEDAVLVANLARENIEKLKIQHTGNSASKYVTISSGLYIIDTHNNTDIDDIYKKADEALYKAKQSGRNQVCVV